MKRAWPAKPAQCLGCDGPFTFQEKWRRARWYCGECRPWQQFARERAGGLINRAITLGRFMHAYQFFCEDCGKQAQVWDHRDYSKPYKVDPVCQKCNSRRGPALWRREWNIAPRSIHTGAQ